MTITDYLLARIAEDEAAARDELAVADRSDPSYLALAFRMAMKRVLVECEAKRRIIEIHRPEDIGLATLDPWCATCCEERGDNVAWPCDTLRTTALIYADHPDFRDEWRI